MMLYTVYVCFMYGKEIIVTLVELLIKYRKKAKEILILGENSVMVYFWS